MGTEIFIFFVRFLCKHALHFLELGPAFPPT
jgi:hypothetical protein